jgi:hypothetical protein
VHLRHRHGDAAGDAGDREQHGQRIGRKLEIDLRRPRIGVIADLVVAHLRAQDRHQDRHQDHANEGDADMRGAPADRLYAFADERRPHRARDVIAARDDGHGKSAIALEPVRGLRHQRREGRRGAEPDQEIGRDELPELGREPRQHVGNADESDADRHRRHDAELVGDLAGDHAAEAEAEHHQCEGQRHRCARGGELGLHDGNHHDDGPHADTTDRTDQQRKQQPHPSLTRIRGE